MCFCGLGKWPGGWWSQYWLALNLVLGWLTNATRGFYGCLLVYDSLERREWVLLSSQWVHDSVFFFFFVTLLLPQQCSWLALLKLYFVIRCDVLSCFAEQLLNFAFVAFTSSWQVLMWRRIIFFLNVNNKMS